MTSKNQTIPYTYLIGWTQHNVWYYGRRATFREGPKDFWVKYFTSSSYVAEFRKKHGEPDVIQIRKIFKTSKACARCEQRAVRLVISKKNGCWLNKGHPPGVRGPGMNRKPDPNFEPNKTPYAQLWRELWALASPETKQWIQEKIAARS